MIARAVARGDHRDDALAVVGVRQADHRDVGDVGVRGQGALDFDRVDVVAACDDHVLEPVDQGQVAIRVDAGQVAGVQPAAPEGLGGLGGLVPVTLHHRLAAKQQFTDAARADVVALRVGHARLGERQRLPAAGVGTGFDLLDVAVHAARAALGLPAQLDEAHLRQCGDKSFDCARGHGGGAEQSGPPAGQVAVGEVRQAQQELVHRGNAEEHRDPFRLQRVEHGGRVEAGQDHVLGPDHGAGNEHDAELGGVVERRDVQEPVAGPHAAGGHEDEPGPHHPRPSPASALAARSTTASSSE